MQLSNKYKVKAGSVIESVIAMTIIAVCLSMALIIYARVLDTDNSMAHYQARQKVKELLWETRTEKVFEDEDYDFGSFLVDKKVEELENNIGYKVVFTIKVNSKKETHQYIVR
ncbi:hypothetical protein U6A24_11230 [Aquimarina gracilis]|uniref:Pilin/secretion family protein with methylation motif n=1 Tax=Aquimarina gracilis TaxID=874422 RepID=A0ABU5ZW06_9FLAO|nr:hypothetical protein [Aquimarina gracilis]MEB3346038.1 hypothetical protein [Aquimarina gracilis]